MTPPDTRLLTRIDTPLPGRLASDQANVVFLSGACWHDARRLTALELSVEECRQPVMAHSLPRPDLASSLGERAYRSGFWGIITVPDSDRRRTIEVELDATLDDGSRARRSAASIELTAVEPLTTTHSTVGNGGPQPLAKPTGAASPRIAICMATYEPPLGLLEQQIESIRDQTNRDWVCVISDDNSSPETFDALESLVTGDPRFTVSRSDRRLGFFHNFERALRMAPRAAEFVALADQDDRWRPDKLDALLAAIGQASLAYSDARIVTGAGEVLSPTYWNRRRNNCTNFASLLLANTVSGSAALYRRRVIDRALPFPPSVAKLFHDHWLALVGIALGEIAYLDRPLYDYVQHERAALGHERAQAWAESRAGLLARLRHFRNDPAYFYEQWRITYFQELCRVAVMARLLLARCDDHLSAPRRRALRRLADPEHPPTTLAWLAARGLRGAVGRNETVGAEGRLLRACAWRRLLAAQPMSSVQARTWLPARGDFPGAQTGPMSGSPIPPPRAVSGRR